jgi:hypothetical protein
VRETIIPHCSAQYGQWVRADVDLVAMLISDGTTGAHSRSSASIDPRVVQPAASVVPDGAEANGERQIS